MGPLLIRIGLLVAALGAVLVLTNRLGLPLGQLPGDISIQRPGFSFYFPITTSILVSVVVSAILYLLGR
ncbi:DUF2905 family protein [bacterium]|nr:DUF2905 family protein [bacterium]